MAKDNITYTKNLNLATVASDQTDVTFRDFRTKLAGASDSNMTKLDTAYGNINSDISAKIERLSNQIGSHSAFGPFAYQLESLPVAMSLGVEDNSVPALSITKRYASDASDVRGTVVSVGKNQWDYKNIAWSADGVSVSQFSFTTDNLGWTTINKTGGGTLSVVSSLFDYYAVKNTLNPQNEKSTVYAEFDLDAMSSDSFTVQILDGGGTVMDTGTVTNGTLTGLHGFDTVSGLKGFKLRITFQNSAASVIKFRFFIGANPRPVPYFSDTDKTGGWGCRKSVLEFSYKISSGIFVPEDFYVYDGGVLYYKLYPGSPEADITYSAKEFWKAVWSGTLTPNGSVYLPGVRYRVWRAYLFSGTNSYFACNAAPQGNIHNPDENTGGLTQSIYVTPSGFGLSAFPAESIIMVEAI